MEHVPVLISEVLDFLEEYGDPKKVLDCTLGLGGYSDAILKKFPDVMVWGIDQDDQAIEIASERLRLFGGRFHALRGNFESVGELVGNDGPFDVVLFDLGVSNLQITEGERGFSFQTDGPLDMRMNLGSNFTAATVVNEASEKELAEIFWRYGEERFSRQIAKGIVTFRENLGIIETTATLVNVIRKTLPAPVQRKMGGHPARKVFQALRIKVNDELAVLQRGLQESVSVCGDRAILAVVSYHSLEDRIVKFFFRNLQDEGKGKIVTKRPVIPSKDEIERNYKARSAKLRVFLVGEGKGGKKKWWMKG